MGCPLKRVPLNDCLHKKSEAVYKSATKVELHPSPLLSSYTFYTHVPIVLQLYHRVCSSMTDLLSRCQKKDALVNFKMSAGMPECHLRCKLTTLLLCTFIYPLLASRLNGLMRARTNLRSLVAHDFYHFRASGPTSNS